MHVELQHLLNQILPFRNQSRMIYHIPFRIIFEEYELILDVLIDPLTRQHLKQDIASAEHITFLIVLSFYCVVVNVDECLGSRVLESSLFESNGLFFYLSRYSEICDLELVLGCD